MTEPREQIEAEIRRRQDAHADKAQRQKAQNEREQDALDAAWVLLDRYAPEAAHTLREHSVPTDVIELGRLRTESGWRLGNHLWVSVDGRWRSTTTRKTSDGRHLLKAQPGLSGRYEVRSDGTVEVIDRFGMDGDERHLPLQETLNTAVARLVVDGPATRRPRIRGESLANRWGTVTFFVVLAASILIGTQAQNPVAGGVIAGIAGIAGVVGGWALGLMVRAIVWFVDARLK